MKEPKIRLKGFSGEWEETTIGDIASVVGGGTPSTGNPSYWNGPIQWFTPSEVGHIKYVDKSERTITTDGIDSSSAKIIPAKSLLLSSRATIGEASINLCECTTNQGFQSLIPNNVDLEFLYSMMVTKKRDLIRESNGSTFLEISASKVRSVKICIPSKDEQQALGTYFQHLDSLIQSTTKKIESLKQVKAASLQSMFPQEGETVPRIRFGSHTLPWIKYKLKSIFEERHEVSTIKKDLPQLSFTIAEGIIRPEDRKSNQRDFLIKDKDNKRYLITRFGDIIYNPANVVFGAIHRNSLADGVVSPIYKIFTTNQDSKFMECVVRRQSFINKLSMKTEGTVTKLKTLKPEAFLDMTVYIPVDLEEQKMIGDYFTNLDTQISLQTKRLDKLKQIKSACLDNMFV